MAKAKTCEQEEETVALLAAENGSEEGYRKRYIGRMIPTTISFVLERIEGVIWRRKR